MVPPEELAAAWEGLPPGLRSAMDTAHRRISDFHRAEAAAGHTYESDGVTVRSINQPVDRAGVYVPGGLAAYPSAVLMTVLVARAAGVDDIVLCSPPGPDGSLPATVLAPSTGIDAEWDCWMGSGRSLTAKVTASSSSAALSLAWGTPAGGVTKTSAIQGKVQTSVVGETTVYSRASTVTLGCSADVTADVTTSVDSNAARADRLDVDCRPLVAVTGLADSKKFRVGSGSATVTETFWVSPADAACTAARVSGLSLAPTLTDNTGASRAVSVSASGVGAVRVKVTCSKAGSHAPTSATANLTVAQAPAVAVSGVSGGSCAADATPPTGFDSAWDCRLGTGAQLKLTATASGTDAALALAWGKPTGRVTLSAATGKVQTSMNPAIRLRETQGPPVSTKPGVIQSASTKQ